MREAIGANTLSESCKHLAQEMGDIDADDLNLKICSAVNVLPTVSNLPLELLNYIYAEKLVDLYQT